MQTPFLVHQHAKVAALFGLQLVSGHFPFGGSRNAPVLSYLRGESHFLLKSTLQSPKLTLQPVHSPSLQTVDSIDSPSHPPSTEHVLVRDFIPSPQPALQTE